MKKKLWTQFAKLAALTFAAVIIVSGSDAMTVHAGWDLGGNPTEGTGMAGEGGDKNLTEEDLKKMYEELLESASGKYADVNTLNATVKISTNILKAKKKAGSYVKQLPKPSKVVVKGKALKCNKKTKDYSISYQLWNEDNQKWNEVDSLTSPGLYRLWIGGKGNYKGIYTKRIYVYDTTEGSKSMSSVKVKVNKVPYSGEAITSGVIVSAKLGKRELIQDTDYTVTYLNNVNSGTGIVRLTATKDSGLVGEKEVNFTITGGTKISKAKVTGLTDKTYNYGKAVTQDMSQVKLTVNGNELKLDKDYAVQYYMNNTKVGTAKIVIAGKGSYYGTITKSFKITKIPITKEMLDEESKNKVKGYTGKPVKTGVGLLDSRGEQLKEGTDYTLSYKNNIKPSSEAVIIVKGKGNYTGSFNVNFTIQDKSKSDDTHKAAGIDSETKSETEEEVADTPEESVTDEVVTDTTEETPDTEANPAEDETPAEDGAENGSGDEEETVPDETDNAGSEDADNTTSDEAGNVSSDDADNTVSDETGNTSSDDAVNTAPDGTNTASEGADDTDTTDSGNADNTVSDETGSIDSDNISNNASDDANDAVSDNAVTSPETQLNEYQLNEESAIPKNTVSEDVDLNADAA